MSDDTPVGQAMDWGTAEVHLGKLMNEYRSVALLADLVATGNHARGWMEANKQELADRHADIVRLKKEQEAANAAVLTAKRFQNAAEENAKRAETEAKAVETQTAQTVREAQAAQAGRLKDLDDAAEGRKRVLESDHAARVAELDRLIGAKQALLSEVTAQLEALRAKL